MVEILSREIHLRRRPAGMPVEDDFVLATVPIPELRPGEVLVRNIYMSVDPYMRGRMNAGKSYIPSFQIGEPLTGGAVGQVVAALNGRFQVGDYVTSMLGWREYFVSDGRGLTQFDPRVAPIQAYLGVLGMPGLTAYVGLLDIGRLQDGETVFVSAAGARSARWPPDRQTQGLSCDWERRIPGQGRLAAGRSRRRRRVQLPRGGRSGRRAGPPLPPGHRCLLRERGGRAP